MSEYTKIKDKDTAFQWIDNQTWNQRKKASAKYYWKKKNLPDTIRTRVNRKECLICMEKSKSFPNQEDGKCQHYTTICSSCNEKLHNCPYCRQQWKQQQRSSYNADNMASQIQDGFRMINEFHDALQILGQIWGRVNTDFESGLYERRRRIHIPRLEAELLDDIGYFVMRINEVDREQQVQIISRGVIRRS